MSDILHDLSAPALVGAIWANMFEWYRYLGTSPNAEMYDGPEVTWLLTGIAHPFPNAVLRTRVEPGRANAIIDRVLAHCRSRKVTRLSWWVEADTEPADLGRYLQARGLNYSAGGPGMALDLAELNEDLALPPALRVEPVHDLETLRTWARTAILGFGLPETSVAAWFDVYAGLGFDLPLRSYVGVQRGEPVATSQLLLAAGVAGIYVVATLPKARRQGIGAAVTLAPLLDARAMGYRAAILHSSPMGLGVYGRLGFREYCRMSGYLWSDEPGE